jgi:hypothetical protein
MPPVGFEPTIPAFERVKTVHALDRAATVTGKHYYLYTYNISEYDAFFGIDYGTHFPRNPSVTVMKLLVNMI